MQVTINEGRYRGIEVHNQVFEVVHELKQGAKGWFITVRPNGEIGDELATENPTSGQNHGNIVPGKLPQKTE